VKDQAPREGKRRVRATIVRNMGRERKSLGNYLLWQQIEGGRVGHLRNRAKTITGIATNIRPGLGGDPREPKRL